MPRAPTVCCQPGCPAIANSHGRCQLHQDPRHWSAGASGRTLPRGWKKTRARILARDRHCMIAGPGCLSVATEVDHVIPGGGEHDTNLVAVCRICHKAKSQAEAVAARTKR